MDRKHEEKLFEKYPEMFADRHKPPTETLICFGCECGSGWFDLIDRVCAYVSHNFRTNWHLYPIYRFDQLKEKYGTCRLEGYGHIEYLSKEEFDKKYIERYKENPKENEYDEYIEDCKRGAEHIDGALGFAEYMSAFICEECGSTVDAKIRKKGYWLKTVCRVCADKMEYEDISEEEDEE
jgi:RNase P subunit RPR2